MRSDVSKRSRPLQKPMDHLVQIAGALRKRGRSVACPGFTTTPTFGRTPSSTPDYRLVATLNLTRIHAPACCGSSLAVALKLPGRFRAGCMKACLDLGLSWIAILTLPRRTKKMGGSFLERICPVRD
jgi:hypothetical protein